MFNGVFMLIYFPHTINSINTIFSMSSVFCIMPSTAAEERGRLVLLVRAYPAKIAVAADCELLPTLEHYQKTLETILCRGT